MSHPFDRGGRLVRVDVEVSGPAGRTGATLALDTAATTTALNIEVLRSIGYEPSAVVERTTLTTGSGDETAPRIVVNRLGALGHHAVGLTVVAHDLPKESGIDGLLGLNFFRDRRLTIDFRAGLIALE